MGSRGGLAGAVGSRLWVRAEGLHLGHDVLQLAPGLVGAVIIAEAVHHLLVLKLVLVRD